MLPEYQKKANVGIGLGIVVVILAVVGVVMARDPDGQISAGTVILLAILRLGGAVLFIWGCVMYAKAKGLSGAHGLWGLLGLIGLIVLVVMKDRTLDRGPTSYGFPIQPNTYPPPIPGQTPGQTTNGTQPRSVPPPLPPR